MQNHADKHKMTLDEAIEANYTVKGEAFFVPHYEPAVRYGDEKTYPFIFIDHRSRLNREGRSQNSPWYYSTKSVDPGDENGCTKSILWMAKNLDSKTAISTLVLCLERLKVRSNYGKVSLGNSF